MYSPEQKEEIRLETENQVRLAKSQNQYATKNKISAATVFNLLKKNYETLSGEMWRKLASACGWSPSNWKIVATRNIKQITELLELAKSESEVFGYVSPKGSGKNSAIEAFAKKNRNVFIINCEDHWNKKELLIRILRSMGKETNGLSLVDLVDEIESAATECERPVIILNEFDKVKDEMICFYISLYNRLEGKCAMLSISTPYMKHRVALGIKWRKKGFEEFYSRIGGKFVEGPAPDGEEIAAICRINGVTDQGDIDDIISDCSADLRRVKRLVLAKKRKGKRLRQEVQTDHAEEVSTPTSGRR